MNMRRVFLGWVLLVSSIIFIGVTSANPNVNRVKPQTATASVVVTPNPKTLNPNRGAAGQGNKVRRPVIFGTISRDEWLAKEYFGYLCGELTF
jgi:ABC-type transport system substrate-binding protein